MRSFIGITLGVCAAAAPAHVTELFIGVSAAGQLKVRLGGEPPVHLAPSVFPGYPGWAEGHPGFESTILNFPAEDFFIPSSSCNLRWILLDIGPGIMVLNDTGSGPLLVGQSYFLGNPIFDIHPFWNIYSGRPGLLTHVRIRVHDTTGLYSDSEEVELLFTPEGCYPNCDDSTIDPILNVQDFACFLNKFASGDTWANCDLSTTAPILNVQDFSCFLNTFASGCAE